MTGTRTRCGTSPPGRGRAGDARAPTRGVPLVGRAMQPVPILMQLDASISLPVGPFRLSLRSVALVLAASPLMLTVLFLDLPLNVRVAIVVSVLAGAYLSSVPSSEGIWLGTLVAYRVADVLTPRLVDRGQVRRARVRRLPGVGVVVDRRRRPLSFPSPLHHWTSLARIGGTDLGLFERRPGGWCVVFELEGPDAGPMTPSHADWAQRAVNWVRAVGCAAQFVCTSDHL